MKAISADNSDSHWQKTPVANLMRHNPSGNYYARIRVGGKLIWKSLKTDTMSVAKLRLGDFHKQERQRAEAQAAVSRGKMTFGDALQTYRERLKGDHSLKQRSKIYREERITALLKSWTNMQFNVLATGTSSTLQFGFQNDQSYFGLDDISVTIPPFLLSAPQLSVSKTNFTFQLSGPAGSNYVLQASTNLFNWISISTSTVPLSGTINLTNAISNYNRRFYRAHLQ